ncbi:hypothetical protein Drose_17010 [Dactylosporangium roseum]|uniref:Uncharacterized protein n=1 Tax=Dactylosporangium roseum TaxID=47989 RepID=A0ABY5ZD15_9ACTN|nr:hypothetical protein [Dactylosporangium roseum]UWZ39767.1 hypothetical protein Drose_17010 [Dactylosporangium roseum]
MTANDNAFSDPRKANEHTSDQTPGIETADGGQPTAPNSSDDFRGAAESSYPAPAPPRAARRGRTADPTIDVHPPMQPPMLDPAAAQALLTLLIHMANTADNNGTDLPEEQT